MEFAKYARGAAPFMLALTFLSPTSAHAVSIFSASGIAPADIQSGVDDFRDELGDLNPFTPENFADGRRQINWDAAPDAISDPNDFPPDFFNGNASPRARGIEFEGNNTNGNGATGFKLSSTEASGQPVNFGFGDALQTFSPERLFAPTGGTVFDVLFFDPFDQTTPATTDGFGAVFSNVTDNSDVFLSFYDVDNNLLAKEFVQESDAGGLSFLGASFEDNILAKVTIYAGLFAIDGTHTTAANVVALDDFIFGEPVSVSAVPVPASFLLLLSALAPLGLRKARSAKTA
jgi:hypothetical protein